MHGYSAGVGEQFTGMCHAGREEMYIEGVVDSDGALTAGGRK